MMALADWVGIIDDHDAKYGMEPRCVLELQPSEVDRLRYDLQAAQKEIAGLLAQASRYEKRVERMQDTVDRYKDEAEKAL